MARIVGLMVPCGQGGNGKGSRAEHTVKAGRQWQGPGNLGQVATGKWFRAGGPDQHVPQLRLGGELRGIPGHGDRNRRKIVTEANQFYLVNTMKSTVAIPPSPAAPSETVYCPEWAWDKNKSQGSCSFQLDLCQ